MASISLVAAQVNDQNTDVKMATRTSNNIDAFNTVIDPNTDFIRRTPAVDDGLSDNEESIYEEPSTPLPNQSEDENPSVTLVGQRNDIPSVHKDNVKRFDYTVRSNLNKNVANNMTYPQISYPVAQYLFETNPGLTEKMEQVLNSGSSSGASTTPSQSMNASPSHTNSSNSSLASLTCITNALALRQSTIGCPKVPAATPEQVMDAINKIQLDKKMARQKYMDVNKSDDIAKNIRPNSEKELVPYPPECITTIVQKPNSYWTKSDASPHTPTNKRSDDVISNFSTYDAITMSVDSGYSPLPEDGVQQYQRPDMRMYSANSPRDLDHFETASVISNFSERLEVMSNISGVSGLEEEMFRIKNLLIDSPVNNDVAVTPTICPPNRLRDKSFESVRNQETQVEFGAKKVYVEPESSASKSDFFKIQKEKANLEGVVEVLQNELEVSKEDRSMMQSTLASLQVQLKTQITSCQNAIQEKETVEKDVDKMVKKGKEWASNVDRLQGEIERRNIDLKMLKEELNEAEAGKSKVKILLEETKVDLETRDGTVDGLKKKVAELHVGLQTLNQTNIQQQNDQSSLKSEITALNKSKAWYQQQLHAVQNERSQLQQSLMESQVTVIASKSDAEKLKREVIQLKQQLVEAQQKAVREKEALMRHLEGIEADMMEREQFFKQIQQDRGSLDDNLVIKIKKLEEDKSKVNSLTFTVAEMTNQIETLKAESQGKDAAVISLEKNNYTAKQCLLLKEKEARAKDLVIQQAENQLQTSELKTKQLQVELSDKEEQNMKLKTEKTNVQFALAAANNEKTEVNDALSLLKSNLSKVQIKFKQMKSENIQKSIELEKVQRERDSLETNLKEVEQNLAAQRQEFESQVCMDSQQQGLIVSDLKRQKTLLEKVLNTLRRDLQKSQTDQSRLENVNSDLEQKLREISNSWNTTNDALQAALEAKQFLEGRLQTRERQNLGSNGLGNHDVYKNRAFELQQGLNKCQAEFSDKQKTYKSNIRVLMKKLRQLREKAETEMKLRIDAEKVEIMNGDLGDTDELRVSNERLSKEIEDYRHQLSSCNENLEEMTARFEHQKQLAEHNEKLALDLEREKGRLAGVTQNHSALRQHTSNLEATLAQRESVVSELDHASREIIERYRIDEAKLQETVQSLEDSLNKEKNSMKELTKQLFQDKRENSNLKRQLHSLKEALSAANHHGDMMKMEAMKLKSQLDIKIQAELKHRSEIEAVMTELKKSRGEVGRLNHAVDESQARDPVLTQQMKTLTWHLKQKNDELAGLHEELKLSKETHDSEVLATKSMVQNAEAVSEQLRLELDQVRKEKYGYQTNINDLRTALKASIDQNKMLIEKFNKIRQSTLNSEVDDIDFPARFDDTYVNHLLEQSVATSQTRPLSNLKTCLNALKVEVGELMQQIKKEDAVTDQSAKNCKKTTFTNAPPTSMASNQNAVVKTI